MIGLDPDTIDTVSDEAAPPRSQLDHRSAVRVWRAVDGLTADVRLQGRVVVLLGVAVGGLLALVALQWAAIAWMALQP